MIKSGKLVRFASRMLGSVIRDELSGAVLGRAFIFAWRGRVCIVGYTGTLPLRPIAIPEKNLSYWKIRVGFTGPEIPDFEEEK